MEGDAINKRGRGEVGEKSWCHRNLSVLTSSAKSEIYKDLNYKGPELPIYRANE